MQKFWNFSSSKLQLLTDFWNEFSFFDPNTANFRNFSVFRWKFKFFEKSNLEIWIVCSTFDKFLENLNFFPEKISKFWTKFNIFQSEKFHFWQFLRFFNFQFPAEKLTLPRPKFRNFGNFWAIFRSQFWKISNFFSKSIHFTERKIPFFDDFWERFLLIPICNFQTKKWHF